MSIKVEEKVTVVMIDGVAQGRVSRILGSDNFIASGNVCRFDAEGHRWLRGWYDPDAIEVRAAQTAAALLRESTTATTASASGSTGATGRVFSAIGSAPANTTNPLVMGATGATGVTGVRNPKLTR